MQITKKQWLSQYGNLSDRDKDILSRSYDMIMSNVTEGENLPWSPFRSIRPGSPKYFNGIWNWDTAFHAMCVSRWDTLLAKEVIRSFTQFQKENGQFPDVVWTNGRIESECTKPPVFATYILEVYKRDEDNEFLAEQYGKLVKNLEFFEAQRQENGFYFYSSSSVDNKALYARLDSGWDDSVRWDNDVLNIYPIDLQCYMIMAYRAVYEISVILGKEVKAYKDKAQAIENNVNKYFYDENTGVYNDIYKDSKKSTDVYSPACFMPLFIGIASEKQAKGCAEFVKAHFYPSMPTVAYDDERFVGNYWRGDTWINVAYFAIKGLKDYGFNELANAMREKLLDQADKNKDGIYEKYDARTGKGCGCPCFSWSAAFFIEFILNF